jgi:hypothetical protein
MPKFGTSSSKCTRLSSHVLSSCSLNWNSCISGKTWPQSSRTIGWLTTARSSSRHRRLIWFPKSFTNRSNQILDHYLIQIQPLLLTSLLSKQPYLKTQRHNMNTVSDSQVPKKHGSIRGKSRRRGMLRLRLRCNRTISKHQILLSYQQKLHILTL